jgi:nickel-dependent lactate racemase
MHSLRLGGSELTLPRSLAELEVLAGSEPSALSDPPDALRAAVRAPIAGPSLDAFARGRRIAVVLPDATRPLPTALVEALLEELEGIEVQVRIANGTHRQTSVGEQRRLLGRFYGSLEVGDRLADDACAHRELPGTMARLDARALEADALVLMGPPAFHYLAGYGGGGKLVAPGLADRDTAERIHRTCLAPEGGRHPKARAGVLVGNPLREQIEAVCSAAPDQFYVLPLLDSTGRPTRIFAGERGPAFRAATQALDALYGLPCHRFPAVVVSGGGAPDDLDFVQAHKALEAAADACEPGGAILFAADCGEGLPSRHRAFLSTHKDAAAMERALRDRFDIAAHTVWAARVKAERFRILALTSMERAVVEALGMHPVASLDEAAASADFRGGALLPFGARFLPRPA